MTFSWRLRSACDFDSLEIGALIDRVFREYGDRFAPRRGDRDLATIEASYWKCDGAFVVLELGSEWPGAREIVGAGEIVGTAAMRPLAEEGKCELRRFYIDSPQRGRGAGDLLFRWALDWADLRGFRELEFWSDSRFLRGHRFFERAGLTRSGEVRAVYEGAQPYREIQFRGSVTAIRQSPQFDRRSASSTAYKTDVVGD